MANFFWQKIGRIVNQRLFISMGIYDIWWMPGKWRFLWKSIMFYLSLLILCSLFHLGFIVFYSLDSFGRRYLLDSFRNLEWTHGTSPTMNNHSYLSQRFFVIFPLKRWIHWKQPFASEGSKISEHPPGACLVWPIVVVSGASDLFTETLCRWELQALMGRPSTQPGCSQSISI